VKILTIGSTRRMPRAKENHLSIYRWNVGRSFRRVSTAAPLSMYESGTADAGGASLLDGKMPMLVSFSARMAMWWMNPPECEWCRESPLMCASGSGRRSSSMV